MSLYPYIPDLCDVHDLDCVFRLRCARHGSCARERPGGIVMLGSFCATSRNSKFRIYNRLCTVYRDLSYSTWYV